MRDQELLSQFEESLVRGGMSPATITNYGADIRDFCNWLSEEQLDRPGWGTVTVDLIRHYCHSLRRQGRSVSTVNRRLQAIRKLCDFLIQSGILPHNAADEVERLDARTRSSPRILTDREVRDLLASVGNSSNALARRDRSILLLLLETGIKASELVALREDDLVLDVGSGYVLVGQDLGSGGRCLPIGPEVCAALRAALRLRASAPGVNHLCVSRQGGPLSVRSVQRMVSRYARAAGIEGVSVHTLRHTFAHDVLEDTEDLVGVAKMLGLRDTRGVVRYLE